jgi:hypothetical protein
VRAAQGEREISMHAGSRCRLGNGPKTMFAYRRRILEIGERTPLVSFVAKSDQGTLPSLRVKRYVLGLVRGHRSFSSARNSARRILPSAGSWLRDGRQDARLYDCLTRSQRVLSWTFSAVRNLSKLGRLAGAEGRESDCFAQSASSFWACTKQAPPDSVLNKR